MDMIVGTTSTELRIKDEAERAPWARRALYLWARRRTLLITGIVAFLLSALIAFTMPKEYKSSVKIMPPDQPMGGGALLAALGRASGTGTAGLAALGSGLLGGMGVRAGGDMYIDLMRSDTVTDNIATRFHLQESLHQRYKVDTRKKLIRRTEIVENKKSGVITITVMDTDRDRAPQLAQAYVEELNKLLAQVSTSSARRERQFVETRLAAVSQELTTAEANLSQFSTKTSTVDIKEQTRAMVDAGARLQAQVIVGQSDLESLRQIYGDQNIRVRAAQERLGVVQRELNKMSGSADPNATESGQEMYPPLRQLPKLGVQWADLYRQVRVQEAVYELLSAEYENARIQEAKEIGTVSVVDPAAWPEKKSFPPRMLLTIAGTMFFLAVVSILLLSHQNWKKKDEDEDIKFFARQVIGTLSSRLSGWRVKG